jgi:hypothetical protein
MCADSLQSSVVDLDPDPYVLGLLDPDPLVIGSFYHQAKMVRKP